LKILQDLLGDQPVQSFLESAFTRQPFSMPDRAAPYADLLTWDVVRHVLKEGRSVLRIIKDGKMVQDDAKVSFDEAKRYYDDGCTLLLRYAERSHPGLKSLADDFEQSFRTPVDIQAYCTPPGAQAFLWHYDVEEVFILQTAGAKAYEIRPNTVHPNPTLESIPEDLQYEKERTPLKVATTIAAGDWLYIPSGWWHIARTQAESMHLSVGLMPVSNLKIFDFLKDYLAPSAIWRMRLPAGMTDPDEERKYYETVFQSLARELARHMAAPETVEQFMRYLKLPPRVRGSDPH
jgi:50S ribosomal protein L16 3-hydroxylase